MLATSGLGVRLFLDCRGSSVSTFDLIASHLHSRRLHRHKRPTIWPRTWHCSCRVALLYRSSVHSRIWDLLIINNEVKSFRIEVTRSITGTSYAFHPILLLCLMAVAGLHLIEVKTGESFHGILTKCYSIASKRLNRLSHSSIVIVLMDNPFILELYLVKWKDLARPTTSNSRLKRAERPLSLSVI